MVKALRERMRVLYKYRDLLAQLVSKDIKLKYRRSFLGYVWSVLNPLLIMVVMAAVFSTMFHRNIPHFPAYLLCGNVLFSFMREVTSHSINSITGNASLLKKIYVPKYIFTVSVVTSGLVNLFFSFGALLLVMIFTGVRFTWFCFLIVIPVVELYFFCIGLGLFLAQAAVFFRDIQYIWSVVVTAWLYLTPIFYPLDQLPKALIWAIPKFNPMYLYIQQFRDFTINGYMTWPVLIERGGLLALVMLLVGALTFARTKDRFILYI